MWRSLPIRAGTLLRHAGHDIVVAVTHIGKPVTGFITAGHDDTNLGIGRHQLWGQHAGHDRPAQPSDADPEDWRPYGGYFRYDSAYCRSDAVDPNLRPIPPAIGFSKPVIRPSVQELFFAMLDMIYSGPGVIIQILICAGIFVALAISVIFIMTVLDKPQFTIKQLQIMSYKYPGYEH